MNNNNKYLQLFINKSAVIITREDSHPCFSDIGIIQTAFKANFKTCS